MPVSAATLVCKADVIHKFITIPEFADYIPLLAAAVICLLTTMNDIAAPSVSVAAALFGCGAELQKAKKRQIEVTVK